MPADNDHSAIEETVQPDSRRAWRGPNPSQRHAVSALVALLALVSRVIWQAASHAPISNSNRLVGRTGKLAPALSRPSQPDPGRIVSPDGFGGKSLVIDSWAPWRIRCRTEMHLLEQARRVGQGRIRLLGFDANDSSSAECAILNQVHVTYPLTSDGPADVAIRSILFGVPTTSCISPSGRIVAGSSTNCTLTHCEQFSRRPFMPSSIINRTWGHLPRPGRQGA